MFFVVAFIVIVIVIVIENGVIIALFTDFIVDLTLWTFILFICLFLFVSFVWFANHHFKWTNK